MTAKAKTINLLLYEGDLSGVISIEDSNWNSGELYSAPRESISELLNTDACKKYGVYLLLSQERVYVGQASDLAKRITQHTVGKEWWENVVILTTKDDSLNHSDIDYIETILIEKAQKVNRLDCDNKKKGNDPKVDKFRKVYLGQFLEEALFLMQLIGINVFNDTKSIVSSKKPIQLTEQLNQTSKLETGKGAKKEVLYFLNKKGLSVDNSSSYAAIQESRDEFWINPQINKLDQDWTIILNNSREREIIVLFIPRRSFSIHTADRKGLYVRIDKPDRIDLNISIDKLIDRKSGFDFSKYVSQRYKY